MLTHCCYRDLYANTFNCTIFARSNIPARRCSRLACFRYSSALLPAWSSHCSDLVRSNTPALATPRACRHAIADPTHTGAHPVSIARCATNSRAHPQPARDLCQWRSRTARPLHTWPQCTYRRCPCGSRRPACRRRCSPDQPGAAIGGWCTSAYSCARAVISCRP